jgi:pimeloyl-ACP methyl ester carboxylesterase
MTPAFPQEGTVAINGVDLYYRDWGGEGRTLLLLHGLASHSGIWDLTAPILTSRARVVALDLRGHGKSGKPDHGYDFDTVADDVKKFSEARGLKNPTLVGHSWGGNVILHCAVKHPRQVAGLVMVDGGFIELSARPGWTWDQAKKEMAPPLFGSVTLKTLMERISQGSLAAYWSPDIARIVSSNFHVTGDGLARPNLSRENHMRILRELWGHKPSGLYAQVRCPALVLAARGQRRDATMEEMRVKTVAQAEKLLPQGRAIWMENTVHDVPLQRPQELAQLILDFLQEYPGTRTLLQ